MLRLRRVFGLALALLLTGAGTADAKEHVRIDVCGASRCVGATVVLGLSDHGWYVRPPSGSSFYIVRFHLQNVMLDGLDGPIVYVARRGLWRLQFGGTHLWVHPPLETQRTLARITRGLRACPANARWRCQI
jgi:hypothetical protein